MDTAPDCVYCCGYIWPIPPRCQDDLPQVCCRLVEQVQFTASVRWSGRGDGVHSQVAALPCAPASTAAAELTAAASSGREYLMPLSRPRPRSPSVHSETGSEASSGDCVYTYTDVTPSNGPERDYFKYVGRTFTDESDGGTYKVSGVCDMRVAGARRSTNI